LIPEWPESLRRRQEAEALRLYARLLVEHERVRRRYGGSAPTSASKCRPAAAAWSPLREVAMFQAAGRRAAALAEFCGRFPKGEEAPARVPAADYLAALRLAVELAGDGVVRSGGEPPWGKGRPRAPESAEAFDALCRELRDRDTGGGSLAGILDAADLPPAAPAGPRVLFDAAEYVLVIGETAIALPEGQERDFFRALVTASKVGRVTPVEAHGKVWKGAVDCLRRRIRKATGRSCLGLVVVSARRPVCGYRLHPNVELRYASEVGLRFRSSETLERLAARTDRRRAGSRRDED
jgi:hypothetical protein